ncbi:hypothetical protein [Gordonia hankookensis]|uniref:Uncharacterized protein n=1 Tax=Gordonia hankookensis TaxID=589403 RepID=A0ABR7WIS0_9ACTN|nr:hypothetical protein [Gordonia hankookensis]MBD1322471.1 hypothetical protein [Gordonia hankookensis]
MRARASYSSLRRRFALDGCIDVDSSSATILSVTRSRSAIKDRAWA